MIAADIQEAEESETRFLDLAIGYYFGEKAAK
jgi:hypothetical protein